MPGVVLVVLVRWPDQKIFGSRSPMVARIQQLALRLALLILGLRYSKSGKPMSGNGALVANHASWLDIFSLGAGQKTVFVSKAEVARWPGIGFLARLVNTVFITRNRVDAAAQQIQLDAALHAGRPLLFFPEGTSTDGMRVLPFKSTLFAAFLRKEKGFRLQPVTVIYTAPKSVDEPRFYGWWGDMDLGPHMLQILAQIPQGHVHVVYHAPVKVGDFEDRKAMARALEAEVRSAMPQDRQMSS